MLHKTPMMNVASKNVRRFFAKCSLRSSVVPILTGHKGMVGGSSSVGFVRMYVRFVVVEVCHVNGCEFVPAPSRGGD